MSKLKYNKTLNSVVIFFAVLLTRVCLRLRKKLSGNNYLSRQARRAVVRVIRIASDMEGLLY